MFVAWIVIGLFVVIALFALIVAMQPSEFRITRATSISAPPAEVFKQVNDFHLWQEWSPWAKIDPACKTTFEGAPAGPGAQFAWSGNNKVGEGKMTITDSRPVDSIHIRLEFNRPFKATNIAEFTFQTQGQQTLVTWSMSGTNSFMAKAFAMLMNMDKMVGGEFEKGLAQMKTIVESAAAS
jgi:uncharacterized protein YndB with AHSA1/START domain